MRLLSKIFLTLALTAASSNAALIRFIEFTSLPGTGSGGGEPNRFHVGEVEAFLPGVTLAPGIDGANDQALSSKGASAITVAGASFHGADANLINGVASGGAGAWTRDTTTVPTTGAVGRVDLGAILDIETVRLWQRGDGCCQERLNNFTVNFYGDDGSGGVGTLVDSIAHPGQVATSSFATFSPVPEPSGAVLMIFASLGAVLCRRRS